MGAALYRRAPTNEELAGACITLEEWAGPPVQVWPENVQATATFITMGTQWRSGFSGYTGLDYSALPEVWRRTKVPPEERDAVFADLVVIERAALEAMYEKD